MHNPIRQIQQLQAWRGRKTRDLGINDQILAAVQSAARSHRRLGELIELWRDLLPEDLTAHTVLTGFRNGILQATVDSSATLFEVDRLLRGGVEAEMRRRFRGSLSRVKTRIGPLDPAVHDDSTTIAARNGRLQQGRSRSAPARDKTIARNRRRR